MHIIVKLTMLSLAMAILPYSSHSKDKKEETIYAFGYSTNLNDTTLFLTSIQVLPGATLNKKEKFLEHRNEYGNQLKKFLENEYPGHETCAIFFSKNKKSITKKYNKVKSHLKSIEHTKLTTVPENEFRFKRVDVNVHQE